MKINEKYMYKALELALNGLGETAPNPLVGAVVVRGNRIVGSGYHKRAGLAHAEVNALKIAGAKAKGATLYVNLEPCVHHGKTPPCVDEIIKSKIKKVVVGTLDPNPLVNGKGVKKLRLAGILVEINTCKPECLSINEAYFHKIITGKPLIIAKAAISLDGKIAAKDGSSKWISSVAARQLTHKLRLMCDSIMVGANTIRKDDPKLNVRVDGKIKKRKIIVVSENMKIPTKSKILKDSKNLLFITSKKSQKSTVINLRKKGADFIETKLSRKNNFKCDWKGILKDLAKKNINSVLVEGGGVLLSSMVNANVIDCFVFIISPKILGGNGVNLLPNVDIENISKALNLHVDYIDILSDEIIVQARPA